MSCSSCFSYNTKHIPQRSVSRPGNVEPRLPGLSTSPPSWPVYSEDDLPYFRVQWPQLMCEPTAVPPLPQVTSVHYVETTCVPRACSKRWKMIWKRHSGNWTNRDEGCSQEGWTATGRIHSTRGLQKWGLLQDHHCQQTPRVRRLGANPEKWRPHLKRRSQHASLYPIMLSIFFGRKTCLFGENEPTALMDNAGEGTPGTGLWERKYEQKKPF